MRFIQGEHSEDPEELEVQLGYRFEDPSLLQRALTHKSFSQEQQHSNGNNQRLEFLGDAVLGLVIATELLQRLPDGDEGSLSRLRASLVRGGSLAGIGRRLNIGKYLLLGNGEEQSGGREKDKLIEDAVEAVLGALYRDASYQVVRDVILRLFESDLKSVVEGGTEQAIDYKSRLQEFLQRGGAPTPTYHIAKTWGPDHRRQFECEVHWSGKVLAAGEGGSKKSAEKVAAKLAFEALMSQGSEEDIG